MLTLVHNLILYYEYLEVCFFRLIYSYRSDIVRPFSYSSRAGHYEFQIEF